MEHCDFVPLRNMLIRTHLQDLKEVTNNVHYENYRCRKLAGVAGGGEEKVPNKVCKMRHLSAGSKFVIPFLLYFQNPMAQIEEERSGLTPSGG